MTTKKTAPAKKTIEARPSYNFMILQAYEAVTEYDKKHGEKSDATKFGITRPYIKKYLQANYKISPDSAHLRLAMRRLLSAPEGKPRLIPNKHRPGHFRPSKELKAVTK